ncbi:hypothetical protein IPP24_01525 [Candidatus Saccharibacteria bacterium]|nr:MAG: hypothetical protein IPP24_01525 [Candidatus Saccharibacteria bacterium]
MADDKSSKEVSLNLDDPKYSKGLSVGEWQKLSKQDPTTLTPSQQKSLTQANDSFREATKGLSAQLANMTKGISIPGIRSLIPDIPKASVLSMSDFSLPPIETYQPNFDDIDFTPDTTMVDNQIKQTALLERLLEVQSQQQQNSDLMKLIEPRYDRKKRVITFANTQVRLTADSDNEIICKKLFWDGRPVRRPVEKGDIMELLGTTDKKAFYNKVASLNKTVEKATGVEKLFDFVDKKLWFNTKYVELPL